MLYNVALPKESLGVQERGFLRRAFARSVGKVLWRKLPEQDGSGTMYRLPTVSMGTGSTFPNVLLAATGYVKCTG